MKLRRVFANLFITVAIAFALVGCGQSPENVSKQFYKALEEGEPAEVRELSTYEEGSGDTLTATKIWAIVDTASSEINQAGGIKSFKTNSTTVNGDNARVAYTVEYGNGEIESGTMVLVRKDGEWKVDIFASE
jgi:hypothetical protein